MRLFVNNNGIIMHTQDIPEGKKLDVAIRELKSCGMQILNKTADEKAA